MKRNNLTTAVLAGVAGVAGIASVSNAVNLNPDGLGQVLIYPFYTVNGGNDTLLSVVNTTDTVKAVKVRFLESKNSLETLDFNLYLSPFDVWTGAITDVDGDDAGVASLITADNSCTVPSIFDQRDGTTAGGLPFVNFKTLRFNEFVGVDSSPERTREGHFEMIEMGVVNETEDSPVTGLEAAAIHTTAGVPFNCGALVSAWIPGGIWSNDPDRDMLQPAGGLFGGASVISVSEGVQMSYNADAIDAFYADTDPTGWNAFDNSVGGDGTGGDTLHANPGSELPTLNQAQTGSDTATVQSIVFDNGVIVTSEWSPLADVILFQNRGRVDAVSSVFMHNEIYNEFAIESVVNGQTEWVVTQPTKRFYVNNGGLGAFDPYTVEFNGANVADGAACEPIGIGFLNREEGDPGVAPGQVNFSPFDPASPLVPVLCYEAQVVSFTAPAANKAHLTIFGSPNARNVSTGTVTGDVFESGWSTIFFTQNVAVVPGSTNNPLDPEMGLAIVGEDRTLGDTLGNVFVGLPVTGFSAQTVSNGTLTDDAGNNLLSNYAGLFKHRADRRID